PEAGSVDDGFWPATSNIIPIAENTLDQNIYAARLTATYAEVKDISGPFIQQNGYFVYNIERLGLQPGTFNVSIVPIGGYFQSVGGGNSHAGMAELQNKKDSIGFSLINGLTPGTVVRFLLNVNNGFYTSTDTITRIYGTPVTAFSDNCTNTLQWTGIWGLSGTQYVSPAKSITDSPTGNYPTNANTKTTTTSNISLSGAVAAYLEYYAQWQLEKNYDYTEVQVSTNNGTTFTPLCAKYTHDGNSNQDQGQPLYDGFQRIWVKESVDLSAYLGQNIKLRFNLVSDGGVEYDGFYFDDITVKVINPAGAGVNQIANENYLQLYPNPNNGKFFLGLNDNVAGMIKISVFNILGEPIYTEEKIAGKLNDIDLSNAPDGTYFVQVKTSAKNYMQKIIIIR
ncbi:MAG: T9SS type A sorting domain-containing protein, partial [Bacteroidia bacterium]